MIPVKMASFTYKDLIDVAIGSPESGHVNFYALHVLLSNFASKLECLHEYVEQDDYLLANVRLPSSLSKFLRMVVIWFLNERKVFQLESLPDIVYMPAVMRTKHQQRRLPKLRLLKHRRLKQSLLKHRLQRNQLQSHQLRPQLRRHLHQHQSQLQRRQYHHQHNHQASHQPSHLRQLSNQHPNQKLEHLWPNRGFPRVVRVHRGQTGDEPKAL